MDAMRTRLADVLAAYGADPARWPVSEREGLEATLRSEPELLAQAVEIDRVLAKAVPPAAPADAKARLLARVAETPQQVNVVPLVPARSKPRSSVWSWSTAAALAASFAVGIFLGNNTNFANF